MKCKANWKLVKRKGRKAFVCRYQLPGDPRWHEETTGETRKRKAEAAARQIVVRAVASDVKLLRGWAEFRHRYESEHLAGSPAKTLQAFQTAANRLEQCCHPQSVDAVTSAMLVRFAAKLRAEKCSPGTIAAYRSHLLAALKWAVLVGLLNERPQPPPLPSDLKTIKARGRPLAREELERMAMQLPAVVGERFARRWAWNLEGLWRSGFRLGETLVFYWEATPGAHYIDNLDGRRPMIIIDEGQEKGKRDRMVPMAPDFAAMLRQVPTAKRRGLVFRWTLSKGDSTSTKTIGRRISDCGKGAGIVTAHRMIEGEEPQPQYATAQDLRRSFGSRWAAKVMPVVLRLMMRHSSIETTMKFYVGHDANRTAEALWQAKGAILGDMLDSMFSVDDLSDPIETEKHVKK